jgi:hypothetical protein
VDKPPAPAEGCPADRSADDVGESLAVVCLPQPTTAVAVHIEQPVAADLAHRRRVGRAVVRLAVLDGRRLVVGAGAII